MSSDDRFEGPGSTDKPLGDAGSGASGGGSFGNQPGPGAATGGDPKQGVRQPNAGEVEPEERRLGQQPHQTAEVPLGSGDRPEAPGKGGQGPEVSDDHSLGQQDVPPRGN
ncbi:hypothetical protein [Caballeronia sp. Lep1P3]|uniref:hypothetical protein n=1 Tax=Caballeronia sp. Lep1P3 TaxID=2878150 RepID=UPI001FD58011|nr:hypothetical protein [Caballeronia sp. Lep1P3]